MKKIQTTPRPSTQITTSQDQTIPTPSSKPIQIKKCNVGIEKPDGLCDCPCLYFGDKCQFTRFGNCSERGNPHPQTGVCTCDPKFTGNSCQY